MADGCLDTPGPKLIEEGDLNVNLYHRVYFTLLLKECLVWYALGTTHFGPSRRGRTVVADCAMVLAYCA